MEKEENVLFEKRFHNGMKNKRKIDFNFYTF